MEPITVLPVRTRGDIALVVNAALRPDGALNGLPQPALLLLDARLLRRPRS
jgi:hypothetical protein